MPLQPLQLLVIDDSIADARLLRSLLNQAYQGHFELVHEKTPDAGLAALELAHFDCVFLDYMLGDFSGLEVLQTIRNAGIDTPIIAISGNGSEDVAVEMLKRGAQDYMVKGMLTPAAVLRSMSNAIDKVSLTRKIQDKQRELEDFAHVAAHDLRGPLNSVHSLVSLVLDGLGGECDEKAIALLRRADAGVMHMSQMLNSLLEYAEIGRSQKAFEPVDLTKVLVVVKESLTARITSARATIVSGELPIVLGDEVALTQLLQNLLANAIKFCRDRPPVVKVSAQEQGDRWRLSVADNGIGIAEENLERVFAPFKRLHKQGEFEGSGIGLATCQKIAQQHGGEIQVESTLGEGTTFHVSLARVSVGYTPDPPAMAGRTATENEPAACPDQD